MNNKFLLILILVIIPSVLAYSYNSSDYQNYNPQDYQKQMQDIQKQINKQIEETQKQVAQQVQDQINKQVQQTTENVSKTVAQNVASATKESSKTGRIIIGLIIAIVLLFLIFKAYSYNKTRKAQKEFASVKGELAVIMFTDMKSFSKHVGKHESETLDAAWEYEKIMKSIIPKYGGKVIKTIGDAVMATFKSAVHAVNCAKEIQSALEGKKLKIRIGLHLGEVAHKEGDVFGNNVNIAARIEGKAPPGGVAVSEDLYKQVNGKVKYKLKFLSEEKLKNIKEPVKLYRVV